MADCHFHICFSLLLGFLLLLFKIKMNPLKSKYPLMQSNLMWHFVLRNIINISVFISNSDPLLLNYRLVYTTTSSPSGCLRQHELFISNPEPLILPFPKKSISSVALPISVNVHSIVFGSKILRQWFSNLSCNRITWRAY